MPLLQGAGTLGLPRQSGYPSEVLQQLGGTFQTPLCSIVDVSEPVANDHHLEGSRYTHVTLAAVHGFLFPLMAFTSVTVVSPAV